jgi:hypothetical protein
MRPGRCDDHVLPKLLAELEDGVGEARARGDGVPADGRTNLDLARRRSASNRSSSARKPRALCADGEISSVSRSRSMSSSSIPIAEPVRP